MQIDGRRRAGGCRCCGETSHSTCLSQNQRNIFDFLGALFCDTGIQKLIVNFPDIFGS